ncbi:CHC2 zinc finger domain-containing protein [Novosphingobium aquae]|uniref:CHC2 zinc finger domain-containing protein n=1 Tax=Novosphingobium aquae TaxID=3133435 RepID=A0ABU8SDU0_9SPHN
MHDFQQIKKDYPIAQVAELLGLTLKKAGNTFRCQCPSGEGNERGMVITPDKGIFYSFPKQKGGDVLSLVSFVKGCSLTEAASWLVGDTKPEKKRDKPDEVRESSAKTETAQPEERGFRELDYLQPEHDAVCAIGFDTDDAKRIGVGYSPRGVLRGTVAIPVRDRSGKLLGYVGARDVVLPSSWHF